MKYYSELLDKKFDTKEELIDAEGDYEIKRARKEEAEKQQAERLKVARDNFEKAAKEYWKIAFENHPSFTTNHLDLFELMDLLFN